MRSRWSEASDWTALERPFVLLDELRRQMDRVWTEVEADRAGLPAGRFASELVDEGASLKLTAILPGLTEKDVQLDANQENLTLRAERQTAVPEGYTVHRRERASARLARSYALPCAVDVEKIDAKLANGVLTVTLPKVPEAQPRTIAVQAG
jgi:HSP20 family protein